MRRILTTGLVVTGMCLLMGCATDRTEISQSDSFKYPNIRVGKILVGGAVDATGNLKAVEVEKVESHLFNQIRKAYADTEVAGAGIIKREMGSVNYDRATEHLRKEGTLSEEWINKMADQVEDFRFVIFLRIDKSQVQKSKSEKQVITKRNVDVYCSVVDLTRREIAWSGVVQGQGVTASTLRPTRTLASTNRSIEPEPDYPPAPGLVEAVGESLVQLVKHFPQRKSR